MLTNLPDTQFNKNISLIPNIGEPTLIVDGLIESGHILTHIWKTGINYHLPKFFEPKKILLLGLGGGSNAIYVHRRFPKSEITAIEIDPEMPKIADQYFKLDKKIPDLKVIVADALPYIDKMSKNSKEKWDLVLVDCFIGQRIPKKLEDIKFFQNLYKLSKYVLINRIWYNEHHQDTTNFLKKLSQHFVFSRVHTTTNVILSLL